MKMKLFGLTEIKLFHFHRIFKHGGGEGGRSNPLNPPPPCIRHCDLNDPGLFFNVNDEAISITILKLYDKITPIYGKNF